VQHLKRCGVEAIAVCLFWSIVNPDHERRVREIVQREWPGIPLTLSHELNPIPREYRRMISTAINASLYPIVSAYITKLADVLRAGYGRELLIANCVGGMMPPEEIIRRPIYSVMSGPTLAPIAGMHLTRRRMSSSSTWAGRPSTSRRCATASSSSRPRPPSAWRCWAFPRSMCAPSGRGRQHRLGRSRRAAPRGPHSASARPGPACYGRGGTEATVTDANVVLGIIDPDYFLGGRMKLDRAKAEAAVGQLAAKLRTGWWRRPMPSTPPPITI
jgi:N-methylhydantoinase A/acetone carboxylase, beta subunit